MPAARILMMQFAFFPCHFAFHNKLSNLCCNYYVQLFFYIIFYLLNVLFTQPDLLVAFQHAISILRFIDYSEILKYLQRKI